MEARSRLGDPGGAAVGDETAIAVGIAPDGSEIGLPATSVAVAIGVTLSAPSSTTSASLPSGVIATSMGIEPDGSATGVPGVTVAPDSEIGYTESVVSSTAYALEPSGVTATRCRPLT